MSKPEMTPNQQTLTKARKAARRTFEIFIYGGATLFLIGMTTSYLPNVLSGVVALACSIPLFALSKLIEKKLTATLA
jgi:hypothetical protein